jgi:hypothetical protein
MVHALPVPEVLRCYFDEGFDPHLPAMCLRWPGQEAGNQVWSLPEGVSLTGPAPCHFGVSIQRLAADGYAVRLLWEHTCLLWRSLTRRQLLDCALGPILTALGTDLLYLLDQPIDTEPTTFPHAA